MGFRWSPEAKARLHERVQEQHGERNADIAEKYRAGRRMQSLAAEYGLSYSHVRRIIRELGSQKTPQTYPGRQPVRNERIVAEYRLGYSQREIGEMHGLDPRSVNAILRRMGVATLTKEERIQRGQEGRPRLVIAEADRPHYEKLRRVLGAKEARAQMGIEYLRRGGRLVK